MQLRSRQLGRLFALMFLLAPCSSFAQAHVDVFGDYIVRSSAIPADRLPAATAMQHGISRTDRRGVLNVSVRPHSDPLAPPIPAKVSVTRENLMGQREPIAMREIVENNGVTYFGTFDFDPRRSIRFEVRIQPEGTLAVHTQTFEEKFFARP